MRDIYFVRHGQPQFNGGEPCYLGNGTNPDIKEESKKAAARLKEFFADKGIENYYSSPLKRTRQTLEAFLPEGKTYSILENAKEVGFGIMEGKPIAKWESTFQAAYCTPGGLESNLPEGAETPDHAVKRMLSAIAETEGNCVIVAHGAIINLTLNYLLGLPYHTFLSLGNPYMGISKLKEENGKITVEYRGFEY